MKINNSSPSRLVTGKIEIEFTNKDEKTESINPQDTVTVKPDDGEVAKLQKQLSDMAVTLQELKKKNDQTEKQIEQIKNRTGLKGELQLHLDSSEAYSNISKEDGFKMLGYFTEKCLNAGYPWRLKKPGGFRDKGKDISLMEAARRLSNGEEILMQPMRVKKLDLSPTALATVASVAAPGAASVVAATEFAKNANIVAKPAGHEVAFGAPVAIHNFGELKLLTELYDSDIPVSKGNNVSEAAKNMSKFIQTVGSNYPWKIMKNEEDGKVWRVIKGTFSKGTTWALVGAGVGAIIGGVSGIVAQKLASSALLGLNGIAAAAAAGGLGAGIAGGIKGGKSALVGEEISSFEALDRVLTDKPVVLQQEKVNTINIPIFGPHEYFSEYGEANVINGLDELKMFSNILPEEEKKKDGEGKSEKK